MYVTGACSSAQDFLASLATFATAAGWTVNWNAPYAQVPSAYVGDYWLSVSKGECFLNYYADQTNTGIEVLGATGYVAPGPGSGALFLPNQNQYPAGNPVTGQTNESVHSPNTFQTYAYCGAGPFAAYHFFSSTSSVKPYLHAILEINANLFIHWHAGQLLPIGGADPLIYVTSSYCGIPPIVTQPGGYQQWTVPFSSAATGFGMQVYCNVDGAGLWFNPQQKPGHRMLGGCGGNIGAGVSSPLDHAIMREPNTYNLLTPFLPLSFFLERGTPAAPSGNFSYVGDVQDVRCLNMANYSPTDEIPLGADTWKVFPCNGKQLASSNPWSFAFRKNA